MLPPNVLKNSMPLSKLSAMARVVMTAPMRIAVRDRLAEHDDVRHDAVRLERPEVRAQPAEAGLDFVGDADAAGGAHQAIHLGEKSRRHA